MGPLPAPSGPGEGGGGRAWGRGAWLIEVGVVKKWAGLRAVGVAKSSGRGLYRPRPPRSPRPPALGPPSRHRPPRPRPRRARRLAEGGGRGGDVRRERGGYSAPGGGRRARCGHGAGGAGHGRQRVSAAGTGTGTGCRGSPTRPRNVFPPLCPRSGVGLALCRRLLEEDGRIHLCVACRNAPKAEAARDAILEAHPAAQVSTVEVDLGSLASVLRAARELRCR